MTEAEIKAAAEPAEKKKSTRKPKEPTFEESMARLEEIVRTLEEGKCSLDESMKLYEEGVALSRRCAGVLETARQKITVLHPETEE